MLCVTSRPEPVLESKLIQLRDRKKLLTNTCQWVISVPLLPVVHQWSPNQALCWGFSSVARDAPACGHILHPTGWCWAASGGRVWNIPWPCSFRSCPTTRLNLLKAPNQKNPKPLSQGCPQNKLLFKTKQLLGSFTIKVYFCIHLITSCSWLHFSMCWF